MDSSDKWNEYYGKNTTLVPYTEAFTTLLKMKKPAELQGKNFLEIGCGTGNNLFYAKKIFNMNVSGVDFSQNALDKCQSLFEQNDLKVELDRKNASETGYPDETFDVVLDRAAIQHNTLEDAYKIVTEVSRVLKIGGIFISFLASEFHILFNNGEDLGDGNYEIFDEHGIRHFYTKYEIKNLFSKFSIYQFNLQQKIDVGNNRIIESFYCLGMVKQ